MSHNWDCVYRDILEDTSFTLEEFRILLYLAAKPPSWTVSLKQIWEALGIGRDRVDKALTSLRKRGFIIGGDVHRNSKGQLIRSPSVLVRSKVLWSRDPEIQGLGETGQGENPQNPRSDRNPENQGTGNQGPGGQGDLYEEPRGDKPLGEKPEEQEEVDLGISPPEAIRSVDPWNPGDLETSPLNGKPRSPAELGVSPGVARTSVADDSPSGEPSITAELPRPAEVPRTTAKRARPVTKVCTFRHPCQSCWKCTEHLRHRSDTKDRMRHLGLAGADVFYEMLKEWKYCIWCQEDPEVPDPADSDDN